MQDGLAEIPIEERSESEVTEITGRTTSGVLETIRIVADGSRASNPAFDVTPARLVTGLLTERGITQASREGLHELFPERR